MKIGILGGSFDPIHKAHLHMAMSAKESFGLDQVWLIPAGHSPNKDEKKMTSAWDRLEMTRLSASLREGIEACDLEVVSEERSYTYRTLQKLTEAHPEHEFYFIMGGDSLDYFERWVHPEIIASLSHLLVVVRKDFLAQAMEDKITAIKALFPATISLVPCEPYHLSSTEIRSRIADEEFCLQHLDKEVYNYIRGKGLYGLQEA